jgi:hypothetical protein
MAKVGALGPCVSMAEAAMLCLRRMPPTLHGVTGTFAQHPAQAANGPCRVGRRSKHGPEPAPHAKYRGAQRYSLKSAKLKAPRR